jgi:HPt (histidine-containing phosphotransfer) domain-containing protein
MLNQLADEDDPNFMQQLLQDFIQEAQTHQAQLANLPLDRFRKHIHHLRGSASNVGAAELELYLRSVETSLKTNNESLNQMRANWVAQLADLLAACVQTMPAAISEVQANAPVY